MTGTHGFCVAASLYRLATYFSTFLLHCTAAHAHLHRTVLLIVTVTGLYAFTGILPVALYHRLAYATTGTAHKPPLDSQLAGWTDTVNNIMLSLQNSPGTTAAAYHSALTLPPLYRRNTLLISVTATLGLRKRSLPSRIIRRDLFTATDLRMAVGTCHLGHLWTTPTTCSSYHPFLQLCIRRAAYANSGTALPASCRALPGPPAFATVFTGYLHTHAVATTSYTGCSTISSILAMPVWLLPQGRRDVDHLHVAGPTTAAATTYHSIPLNTASSRLLLLRLPSYRDLHWRNLLLVQNTEPHLLPAQKAHLFASKQLRAPHLLPYVTVPSLLRTLIFSGAWTTAGHAALCCLRRFTGFCSLRILWLERVNLDTHCSPAGISLRCAENVTLPLLP